MMKGINDDFIPSDVEDGKFLAILAYIPFLCLIPYFESQDGNNTFVREHSKQGMVLFFIEMVAVLAFLLWKAIIFIALAFSLASIIFVILGKYWSIPLIDRILEELNL